MKPDVEFLNRLKPIDIVVCVATRMLIRNMHAERTPKARHVRGSGRVGSTNGRVGPGLNICKTSASYEPIFHDFAKFRSCLNRTSICIFKGWSTSITEARVGYTSTVAECCRLLAKCPDTSILNCEFTRNTNTPLKCYLQRRHSTRDFIWWIQYTYTGQPIAVVQL